MKKLTWSSILKKEKNLPYFQNILSFLSTRKKNGAMIYPQQKDIFNVFRFTSFESVKVVIIGQDPYPNPKQAHGLAFSVQPGIPIPPSLKNIYKELSSDIPQFNIPNHGCLINWAKEGVFLLNSILTVEHKKIRSHANIGWEIFTNKVITALNIYRKKIIFLLWGNDAKKKIKIIDNTRHYILQASHPSPFSANQGFFGCRHFSKTNYLLLKQKTNAINWQIKQM